MQRFADAESCDERFGAGDDNEVAAALRRFGGTQLRREDVNRHKDVPAGCKAVDLLGALVFDRDSGDATRLEPAHHFCDGRRVAEAGIAVGHHRYRHRFGKRDCGGEALAHRDHSRIRQTARRARFEAAGPDAVESGARRQAGAEGIVGTDEAHDRPGVEQGSQTNGTVHAFALHPRLSKTAATPAIIMKPLRQTSGR